MRSRRGGRPSLAGLLTIVIVLLATACGITTDGAPRDVEENQRELLIETRSENEPRAGNSAKIYFLAPAEQGRTSKLRAVGRDVSADAESVLTALFDGLTAEEQALGLRTAIPAGTRLNGARFLDANTLAVDVSPEFLGASGEGLTDAVAQIVFSANEVDNEAAVLLSVDGQQTEWPTGTGSLESRALTAFDYPERNPTSQPDFPSLPSPQARVVSSDG